jgi:hypothetical protein
MTWIRISGKLEVWFEVQTTFKTNSKFKSVFENPVFSHIFTYAFYVKESMCKDGTVADHLEQVSLLHMLRGLDLVAARSCNLGHLLQLLQQLVLLLAGLHILFRSIHC